VRSLHSIAAFASQTGCRKPLWGGEFWEDGYFVHTVGDKVTAEVIRKYIQYHRTEKESELQFKLFE
jgi:putative transposase